MFSVGIDRSNVTCHEYSKLDTPQRAESLCAIPQESVVIDWRRNERRRRKDSDSSERNIVRERIVVAADEQTPMGWTDRAWQERDADVAATGRWQRRDRQARGQAVIENDLEVTGGRAIGQDDLADMQVGGTDVGQAHHACGAGDS